MEGLVAQLVFQHGFEPHQLIGCQRVCREWRNLLVQDRFWWRHYAQLEARWKFSGSLIADQPGGSHYRRYQAFAQRVLTMFNRDFCYKTDIVLWKLMARVAFGPDLASQIVFGEIGPMLPSPTLFAGLVDNRDLVHLNLTRHHFTLGQLELRRQRNKRKFVDIETYTYVSVHWFNPDETKRMENEKFVDHLLTFVFEPRRFQTLKPLLVL